MSSRQVGILTFFSILLSGPDGPGSEDLTHLSIPPETVLGLPAFGNAWTTSASENQCLILRTLIETASGP